MTWTLISFIITCALAVLAILALPLGPRLMHATAAHARALRPFRAWVMASGLGAALNVAISDASDLGWLHIDHAILSQMHSILPLACGAALLLGVWNLPNHRSKTMRASGNEQPSEQ